MQPTLGDRNPEALKRPFDRPGPTERVRIEGHIIDSLILPKVLDIVLRENAAYHIAGIEIGNRREDASWAEIDIRADDAKSLERVLRLLTPHGAAAINQQDCRL